MADDIAPNQVWEALRTDPQARLVDVRTDAEWNFVGLPDLAGTGQDPVLIPWQVFPTMQLNGAFVDQLRQAGLSPDSKLYFMCRSGGRSLAAARAAEGAGFPHAQMSRTGSKARQTATGIAAPWPGGRRRGCPGGQR